MVSTTAWTAPNSLSLWLLLLILLWRKLSLSCTRVQRLLHCLPGALPRLAQWDFPFGGWLTVQLMQGIYHFFLVLQESAFLDIESLASNIKLIPNATYVEELTGLLGTEVWPYSRCILLSLWILPLCCTLMVVYHLWGWKEQYTSSKARFKDMLETHYDMRMVVLSMPAIFILLCLQNVTCLLQVVTLNPGGISECVYNLRLAEAFQKSTSGIQVAVMYELFSVACYTYYCLNLVEPRIGEELDQQVCRRSLVKITQQTVGCFIVVGIIKAACSIALGPGGCFNPIQNCPETNTWWQKIAINFLGRPGDPQGLYDHVKDLIQLVLGFSSNAFIIFSLACLFNFDVGKLPSVQSKIPNTSVKFLGTRVLVSIVAIQKTFFDFLLKFSFINIFQQYLCHQTLLCVECTVLAFAHLAVWGADERLPELAGLDLELSIPLLSNGGAPASAPALEDQEEEEQQQVADQVEEDIQISLAGLSRPLPQLNGSVMEPELEDQDMQEDEQEDEQLGEHVEEQVEEQARHHEQHEKGQEVPMEEIA